MVHDIKVFTNPLFNLTFAKMVNEEDQSDSQSMFVYISACRLGIKTLWQREYNKYTNKGRKRGKVDDLRRFFYLGGGGGGLLGCEGVGES